MRLVALLALSRVLCDLGGRYRFVFYSQLREGRKEGGGLPVFHWQCGVLVDESGYEDRKSVPVLGYSIFIDIGTKRVGVCEAESA